MKGTPKYIYPTADIMIEILSKPNAGQIWSSLKINNRDLTKKLVRGGDEIIEMLDNKIVPDINLGDTDMNGMTALMYRADRSTVESMQRILTCKFTLNLNIQDWYGDTALHHAVYSSTDSKNKVELLLKHGANMLIRNSRGYTPLDSARRSCRVRTECIKLLEKAQEEQVTLEKQPEVTLEEQPEVTLEEQNLIALLNKKENEYDWSIYGFKR